MNVRYGYVERVRASMDISLEGRVNGKTYIIKNLSIKTVEIILSIN